MTEDFKLKLLEYITGKLNIETDKKDNIVINSVPSVRNNFYTQLNSQFQYGFIQKGYVQAKDIDNNGTNFMVVYGSYYINQEQTATKGYIAILDNELNLLEIITKYSTGTDFGDFKILNVDETGKFYGIDEDNSKLRFILLNNFTVKIQIQTNYTVVLRQSYFLSGESNNITDFKIMKKNQGAANYILVGSNSSKIIATTIKVEVGVQNEWVDYTYTKSAEVNDLYVNWKEENTEEQVEFYVSAYNSSTNELIVLYHAYTDLDGIWSILQDSNSTNYITAMYIFGEYDQVLNSPIIISYIATHIFIGGKLRVQFSTIECYHNKNTNKIEYKTPAIFTNYTNEDSHEAYIPDEIWAKLLFLKTATNDIFIISMYNINNPAITSNMIINVTATLYDKNNEKSYVDDYMSLGSTTLGDLENNFLICVNKQFNLYSVKSLFLDFDSSLYYKNESRFSYNQNNYNGAPYENTNSLVPNSGILYDENNNIIFARNLYNKVISGGTTTSTVEVPNNYLNDVNISKEELISETNSIINNDTTLIEKNIYEQLYINFINTLNVIDSNNTIQVLNPTGASRINDSISQTMDYDNTKIVKFVINYSDDTSDIRNFCSRTYSLTENRCTYTCIIYVPLDKSISNIQIKSNDGNTTYLTIDTSSLVSGKYYRLSQDLVVE